jgi:hypothetical protein
MAEMKRWRIISRSVGSTEEKSPFSAIHVSFQFYVMPLRLTRKLDCSFYGSVFKLILYYLNFKKICQYWIHNTIKYCFISILPKNSSFWKIIQNIYLQMVYTIFT